VLPWMKNRMINEKQNKYSTVATATAYYRMYNVCTCEYNIAKYIQYIFIDILNTLYHTIFFIIS